MKILSRLPFFGSLSPQALVGINRQFVEIGYAPGAAIYYSGDPASRLFVVADGKVKLLQHAMNGRDVLLDILIPGEFFGSLSLIPTATYADTAQAHTSVCALSITTGEFRTILDQFPGVTLQVLDVMSARLIAANQKVLQLSALTVEQRIAFTLLNLAEKLGVQREGVLLIDTPLSRDELASMTGSTTETASRVMSQFQSDGLVDSGRQWVAILEKSKLEAISLKD
ncbi:MAG: Crp/Fnr family transcriptional regulator [Anaerolineaceae bacterium]|nr:Crp/Fnr family transcriptional regulator [Anaerolineaceae bacterium]